MAGQEVGRTPKPDQADEAVLRDAPALRLLCQVMAVTVAVLAILWAADLPTLLGVRVYTEQLIAAVLGLSLAHFLPSVSLADRTANSSEILIISDELNGNSVEVIRNAGSGGGDGCGSGGDSSGTDSSNSSSDSGGAGNTSNNCSNNSSTDT